MTGLWLLTHRDLRAAARIRAFIDHFAKGLGAMRDELVGATTPPAASA
jgi:hypothetical protein